MSEPSLAPERTALYRLYDVDDRLLYVGISENPERRWQTHSYTARNTWWPRVARNDVTWHATRDEAAEAERKAIATEGPLFNIAGVPSPLVLAAYRSTAKAQARDRRFAAGRHPYEQVADALREAIMSGELVSGDRLPSFTEIRAHFDVTITTARRSLRILKDEDLVEGRRGKGLFVCEAEDRTMAIPVGRPEVIAEILREEMSPQAFASLIRILNVKSEVPRPKPPR